MTRAYLLAGAMFGTWISLAPAHAAERYFCAASDAVVNMSIDSAFDAADALKLSHFRGVVGLKASDAPRETRKIEINSSVLTQYWMDGDELKLRMRILTPAKRPTSIVDIAIDTERADADATRFSGSYKLSHVETGPGSASARPTTHEAPIFCTAKS